jgi:rhodanese-related sulfurtransferase/DNA-binding transcriptional ArsR family regulator
MHFLMRKNKREFKDAIYEQLARIGKAAASPKRLELLDLLGQGPRSVEALAEETGQSIANVSQHLQILRAARLVDAKKEGLYVNYRLADEGVAKFFLAVRELAESRTDEIAQVTRTFFDERDALEPVDRSALIERVRSGEVTVLDVRPVEEFHAGHIPGAVSIPVADLKRRLASLPKYREVVAYCRGPYCVFAVDAVKVLRENGFKAVRMDEGVLEWKARGLPVEVTPGR